MEDRLSHLAVASPLEKGLVVEQVLVRVAIRAYHHEQQSQA